MTAPTANRGAWRLLLSSCCLVGLSLPSCADGVPGGGGGETVAATPSAVHEDGTSLRVNSIDAGGDRTVVELTVVNGSERAVTLSEPHRPITLFDAEGSEHTAAQASLEVPPHATARLRLEFDGAAGGESATLQINSGLRGARTPPLVVRDLPLGRGRVEFVGELPSRISVEDVDGRHPSGLSVSLGELDFRDDEIRLSFQAINGSRNELRLAGSVNRMFLRDNTGRRYYLIPPDDNPDLAIPSGDRASGVLGFAGRLGDEAERLTLHINDRTGGDNEHSRSPRLRLGEIVLAREVDHE